MKNLLLTTSSDKFQVLSTVIMAMVVVVVMILIGFLFYLYYKSHTRCIENNLENEKLRNDLIKKNKNFFQNVESVINSDTLTQEQKKEEDVFISKYLENKENKRKKTKWISIVFTCIAYAIFIGIIIFLLLFRINSQLVFIGNKTGIIVATNSMETVYNGNHYIQEHNLTNQFPSHSFIVLEKINSEDDLNLYDIVAYKDNQNRTIIHRIIDIKIVDGKKLYSCRGDANNASASFEYNMEFSRFEGKYNGYQNYALGVLLTFLRSGIGLITITTAFITITIFEYFEKKITVVVLRKSKEIAVELDKEIEIAIEQNQKVNFIDACINKHQPTIEQ